LSGLGFAADGVSQFEVASIKPSPPGVRQPDCSTLPGGLFTCHNIQLKYLLRLAMGPKISETKGAPSWLDEFYDIDAKVASEKEMTQAELVTPLLALFRERFGLVSHEEPVQETYYLLEQQTNGTKLKRSAPGTVLSLKNSEEAAFFQGETMPALAARLSTRRDVNARVIDRTGLVGQFDFALPYVSADGNGGALVDPGNSPVLTRRLAAAYASTFDSLLSIGLRLRAGKRDGSAFVIDEIHRPTEN
jgi:uncharacterized protein (TIGR03435 family)